MQLTEDISSEWMADDDGMEMPSLQLPNDLSPI